VVSHQVDREEGLTNTRGTILQIYQSVDMVSNVIIITSWGYVEKQTLGDDDNRKAEQLIYIADVCRRYQPYIMLETRSLLQIENDKIDLLLSISTLLRYEYA